MNRLELTRCLMQGFNFDTDGGGSILELTQLSDLRFASIFVFG